MTYVGSVLRTAVWLPLGLTSLSLCSLSAQTPTLTLPSGYESLEGDTRDPVFGFTLGDWRQQTVYDPSMFANLPQVFPIHRIALRADGAASSSSALQIAGVTMDVAYAAAGVDSTTIGITNTWAQNKSDGDNPEFVGSVNLQARTGGSPGEWYVFIDLATPFLYDQSLGLPLIVDFARPSTSGGPQADAVSGAGMGFGTVQGSAAAAGPARAEDRALVLGFVIGNYADSSEYGQACGRTTSSAYEAVDVRAQSAVFAGNGLHFSPNTAGGFDVGAGGGTWHTPTGPSVNSSGSIPVNLPFAFPYPGGSTSQVYIRGAGGIGLEPGVTSTLPPQSPGAVLQQPAKIGVFDMGLSAASGTVQQDVDGSGNAVFTWVGMSQPFWGPGSMTVQCALSPSGGVELRWQSLPTAPLGTGLALVGFVAGAGAIDPGSVDLLAAAPFSTAADALPPTLAPVDRPVMGTALNLTIGEIPSSALYAAVVFSATQHVPGIDLTGQGMPGCFQYTAIADVAGFFPSGPSGTAFLANIPTDPSWSGRHVFAQGVVWVPGRNPFGVITTAGVDLAIDLY